MRNAIRMGRHARNQQVTTMNKKRKRHPKAAPAAGTPATSSARTLPGSGPTPPVSNARRNLLVLASGGAVVWAGLGYVGFRAFQARKEVASPAKAPKPKVI